MRGGSMKGRRLPDTVFGELPEDILPGDYWKYLDRPDGEPMKAPDSPENGNLTGTCWGICAPTGDIGMLTKHTVREEADGSISIRPGDGSSNSVLIGGGPRGEWHGYIEHGVWESI